MKTVIFANGQLLKPKNAFEYARRAKLILAVDGGARHCRNLNIMPHVLLGDLDSISPSLLQHYTKEAVKILRYPADKDKSDLELALDQAMAQGATTTTIFGALGNRWDMSIANLLLLASPSYTDMDITLIDGDTHIHLLQSRKEHILSAAPGSTVSLIPLTGTASGVSLTGLKYPMVQEDMFRSSTLGVSNMMLASEAKISIEDGILLCVVDKS